ncbi:MAG: hypothetical protein H6699_06565 [Myxococcales bacterium]|nr:hypothetical protein [Myxococcales bacterium]
MSNNTAKRPLLFRLAALGLGLLAALAGALTLVLLSGTGPRWDAPLLIQYMDCDHGICRHRANQRLTISDATGQMFDVVANSEGFRGDDAPPPGDGLLVEIYGDSMIHGTGVGDDDTIARNLARELRARLGTDRVYVMNYGMPMNYLVSSLATYEIWGRAHEPDVVVFEYHGGIPSPRDVNALVQQIRGSWWMSRVFENSLGRLVINRIQSASLRHFSQDAALDAVRPGLDLVATDQRDRGIEVVFFSFWNSYNQLDQLIPDGLSYSTVETSLADMNAYRASPYVIEGDGHPNASGTAFFASAIADTVEPLLRRRLPPAAHAPGEAQPTPPTDAAGEPPADPPVELPSSPVPSQPAPPPEHPQGTAR